MANILYMFNNKFLSAIKNFTTAFIVALLPCWYYSYYKLEYVAEFQSFVT